MHNHLLLEAELKFHVNKIYNTGNKDAIEWFELVYQKMLIDAENSSDDRYRNFECVNNLKNTTARETMIRKITTGDTKDQAFSKARPILEVAKKISREL